jgi:acyl carrier protein
LEVLGIHAYEESSFTMVAMFGIDAFTNRVTLQLSCDQTQVEPAYAELMASWYEQALREMATNTEAELEFARQLSSQEPAPASGNRIVTVSSAHRSERPFSPPQSPLEEELAAMWCQVLSVPRVGREDNFFEMGGHSLLATQLISRVRARYKTALPIRELMNAPTVSGLANAVQTALWATQVQHEVGKNADKEEFIV